MAQVHNLKTWTPFFIEAKSGIRHFEVRKNDRSYEVGDTLILEDFNPDTEKYTGGWVPKLVTFKFDDPRFVKEGYVILGVEEIRV